MSRKVNFWGQGNKASVSGEERANILLLACCYQEVSTGWLMWTTLTAYDLNEGAIKWSIPLGEVPELAARGIGNTGTHYPKVGPVITAGGLILTGTRDRKVRAFDVEDGKMLWETQVPEAIEGIPAVYAVGGRQYIVFCAAAQAGLIPATQSKTKGAYVTFALPLDR